MRLPLVFLSFPRAMAVTAIVLGSTGIASAQTFSCDNDRSASSYPNCVNHVAGTWSYYRGQSGDINGDDRRARLNGSNRPGYAWTFRQSNLYTLDVWLANAGFTAPNAIYSIYDYRTKRVNNSRVINQNTARSGWTSGVVAGTGDSALVNTGTSGVTGADAVRMRYGTARKQAIGPASADFSTVDAARPAASCGLKGIAPDVAFLQARMLDASDRFGDASGNYRVWFSNNGQDDTVDFEVSPRDHSSYVRIAPRVGDVEEHMASRGTALALDPATRVYERRTYSDVAPLSSAAATPRTFVNQRCEPVYVMRDDPTGAVGASDALLPQQFAFWLDGGSRIVGSDLLLGRSATVVEGRHDAEMATKLGATTYRMWVDSQTGVLLKLRGDDADGRQVYGLDMRQIAFDSGRPLNPDMQVVRGWKQIDPTATSPTLTTP